MRLLYPMAITLALVGCKGNGPKVIDTSSLVQQFTTTDTISGIDYMIILDGLEYITNEACAKAQNIVDSGYGRKEVRQRLKMDVSYHQLCQHADILDSIVLDYINTNYSDYEVRARYKEILRNFNRKAQKLGL